MNGKEKAADTLRTAASLLDERAELYGDPSDNFSRISRIASVILDAHVTRYEVAAVLAAVKLGRIPNDPEYGDSYDDAINYIVFMKMFREEYVALNKIGKGLKVD